MSSTTSIQSILVIGVAGSGKSTIGRSLSERLHCPFLDADSLHSRENVEKMASGQALSDDDRWPWLDAVGQRISVYERDYQRSVTACSALKRRYRDVVREYAPLAYFVYLKGSMKTIRARIESRHDGFMAPSLLGSQFGDLEPLEEDERGLSVEVTLTPDEIVTRILDSLAAN
ncbi:MAG TPA: gluconokinase [Acidimicrobiales bacterium]|nr:gluconokinase [Acidimicrobiales bacterium]